MLKIDYFRIQKLKFSKKLCIKCSSQFGSECGGCKIKQKIEKLEYELGLVRLKELTMELFF